MFLILGVVLVFDVLWDKIDVVLVIFLYVLNDEICDEIVLINKKYNMEMLIDLVNCYFEVLNVNYGKVIIEYVMLDYVNDEVDYVY